MDAGFLRRNRSGLGIAAVVALSALIVVPLVVWRDARAPKDTPVVRQSVAVPDTGLLPVPVQPSPPSEQVRVMPPQPPTVIEVTPAPPPVVVTRREPPPRETWRQRARATPASSSGSFEIHGGLFGAIER